MQLSNDFIMSEALRLVDEGRDVIFPVKGNSMLPFIIGGKEKAVFSPVKKIKTGRVVLAYVDGCRYVVHRIIKIDNKKVTLMGDGNLKGREYCTLTDIKAEVNYVVDQNEKKRCLNTFWRLSAALLWRILRPVRRYLLRLTSL
ncbi:MAG: S24/S26 family peptidase [Bacteroidales bacterium]|nr:S24/S26 family peptidase [Bacteroidales bacterium]